MTTDTYLRDADYEALIDEILTPAPSLDPRGAIKELLGLRAGVWPESIKPKEDHMTKHPLPGEAFFTVRNGMVHVTGPTGESKSTQIGSLPAEETAKLVLLTLPKGNASA